MQKLTAKFHQTQSAKDALRLLTYLDKHPFAECIAPLGPDRLLIDDLRAKRARAIHAVRLSRVA
jgi:hypothetical protein